MTNKKKETKHKPSNGSLVDLFQSEFFDIHMTINYLYKREAQGIQDYLINNKLYQEKISFVDFYLPQFWLLIK